MPLILYYLVISSNEVENQFVMHFVVTIFANELSVAELDINYFCQCLGTEICEVLSLVLFSSSSNFYCDSMIL